MVAFLGMSTPEGAIPSATPDVSSATPNAGVPSTKGSSPSPSVTGAPPEQSQTGVTSPVQDSAPQTPEDPLAGIPTSEELKALVAQNAPNAKGLAQIREAYEALKTNYADVESKYSIFAPVAEKFSAPEEIQQLVDMRESLLGWENQDGNLVPSTQKFIEKLDPKRAEFLFADLADGTTVDPRTGQSVPRMDRALQFIATDPERRANALKILGAVEPSAVAPQWQPTQEQLAVVKEELQDTFKKLPYDEREALSTNDPDFINKYLAKEKLQNDLVQEREQRAQRDQQESQQRDQLLHQEAKRAGDTYVDQLLTNGLTTFHNSVVEQCDFIKPLDLQNLPQGMTPEQAGQMNAQIAEANKAEAAQITAQIVALINPQTRRYMLPTLKEIGVVDDKLMELIDKAAEAVGNNGRNYGHLVYRGKLTANGNGYQPGPDVTPLDNEAQRNFKLLVSYANGIKGKLMEKRSQFFGMKATGHNQILNGVAASRPNANGGSYDPTTATTQQPTNFLTRREIDQRYG